MGHGGGDEEPSERSDMPLAGSSASSKDLYPAILSSDYWRKRI